MEDRIKVGDNLLVHCYKHDGSFHRVCDEATILEITDNVIVCANHKSRITEKVANGKTKSYRTKETAIMFFYKDSWFNVIAQLKPNGLYYYCNIASPYIIDDGIIKYIDYDLDLRVYPSGAFRVLDRNEYGFNKNKMKYSKKIDAIVKYELSRLIEMKKEGAGPFHNSRIEEYNKMYEKIKNWV